MESIKTILMHNGAFGSRRVSVNKATDAATSVTKTVSSDPARNGSPDKRTWKASEIAKLKPWEFDKFENELDAARKEGRIDINS